MPAISSIECSIPRPSIGELRDAVATELSKRLLGGAPVYPMTSEDVLAFVMAGTTNLMWGFLTQTMKEQDPETACCDNLVIIGARRGIFMQGATRAKGYVVITGTPGAAIPRTIRVVAPSSREYQLDLGATFNPVRLDGAGGAVLRVVSVLPGATFNLASGQSVIVGATIPGIDGTATVVGNGVTGGSDVEDCEAFRRRVIASEHGDVLVVNEAWFVRNTLRYPGVTRVCIDACQGCCDPTWVPLYPFMHGVYGDCEEDPYGVPSCDVLDQMNQWMFGREAGRGQGLAPIGIRGGYMQAMPAIMDISARCRSNFPPNGETLLEDALRQYLCHTTCVGSTICKDHLRAEMYAALGREACMSSIEFHFSTGGIRFADDANIYLECGRFAVLGSLNLQVG